MPVADDTSADFSKMRTDLRNRMESSVDVLKKEFAGLRTGRASIALLDPVMVDAYGQMVPLNQVATVSVPEPRMISVQVWDRSMAKAVDKAIRDAGLGLNPASDGQLIRVPIPPLNEERRKELTKVAGKYAEEVRVAIRNVRRDGMDQLRKLEKDGLISEDEQRKFSTDVQKLTDDMIRAVDEALGVKEQEIMQV
ncbi:ribosome recycling factor [Phaeovibrio sulfidiphilus]|uniref:Ribosome-recycling factor n=2 Tax=Phaeovibrio sulfidiphilus TaxID=1220600 RepID=A0A8J6YIK4_9PROT|nr:ribosome recycling factor [Phaeovibrio sulfidiphilus]